MSKRHNAKGRTRNDALHVRLYHWQINSPAWRSLTPQAKAVYLEIELRYNGFNNGQIGLSVRQAADLCKIAKHTAQRALRDLQDKGFVVATVKGTFHVKFRHATLWRLTRVPCANDNATKDFMRWKPDEKIPRS